MRTVIPDGGLDFRVIDGDRVRLPEPATWRGQDAEPTSRAVRIAQGKERGQWARDRPFKRLAALEWVAFTNALDLGYLVASPRTNASNLYYEYCCERLRPYIVVKSGPRYAGVTLDLLPCRAILGESALAEIQALFESEAKHGSYCGYGRDHCYVEGVQAERAGILADALLDVVIATWELEPGLATYLAERTKTKEMPVMEHDPKVQFFKSGDQFATVTSALDAEEFLREVAEALPGALAPYADDQEFQLAGLLPQVCDIWAKLRGYKAERVFEQRLLIAGTPNPSAYMQPMPPTVRQAINGHAQEVAPI